MVERKFYDTTLVFYVNDINVYELTLNRFYYGYPKNLNWIPKKVKDIEELNELLKRIDYSGGIKKGFRKVKIFNITFKKKDIEEIKIIQRQVETDIFVKEIQSFDELMKALTVNEFIQFCIDNGLAINYNNK